MVILSASANILAAVVLTVASSLLLQSAGALPQRFLWQTLLVSTAGGLILCVAARQRPVATYFGVANQVTLLRAVLVALLCGFVAVPLSGVWLLFVTLLAAFAALLDAADGWLARKRSLESEYGARFDMETDALFVLVLSVLVLQQHKAGVWVLICGLLRYGFVLTGWVWPALQRPLPFSLRRKRIAALQMVLLVAALSPFFPVPFSTALAALAVVTLLASFAIDVHALVRP